MNPHTNRIREWRQARGWSLQQLADYAATSKSQIDKLEKGLRRLTVEWMVRLAKPLGCDPRELLPEAGPRLRVKSLGFASPSPAAMIPVRGLTRGGKREMFLIDRVLDHAPRPYFLGEALDAYALEMRENSMTPMFRPGQTLFVQPSRLPSIGQGAVVLKTNGAALIGAFVKLKASGLTLRLYGPKRREITVPQNDIAALHAIMGATEPGG
ncbi:MAG: helix-turn-helix domain-containing protein [Alphaproteobacteria bacterium]|nr:helix-turn-helix domain-containing protein [Alphaproteobacteria bacterium]